MYQKTKAIPHPLHVVTMVSNTRRYASRYRLYNEFKKHVEDHGAILHTVEVAFGDRPFELHDGCIQARTKSELWIKENALNIGIGRLPADWKYVAWIDADVRFTRPDWVEETLHMLQHHPVIQPWSTALDLDPNHEAFNSYTSFCSGYRKSLGDYASGEAPSPHISVPGSDCYGSVGSNKPKFGHSGYAWAATREAIDHLGGLIDFAIAGAGDRHMAMSLVGLVEESVPANVTQGYKDLLAEWQWRAEKYIRRNIGFCYGTITHGWHGPKKNRGYIDRWRIISRNGYDPNKDIKYDSQDVLQLVDRGNDRSRQLRDDLMAYMAQRDDDSTCMRD